MANLSELKNVRLEKLNMLKAFGMNPYPAQAVKDFNLSDIVKDFKKLEEAKKEINLVGRVMSVRGQGAIIFVSLFDGTAKFQAVFKKDEIEEKLFNLFTDAIDIGDFIQVTGTLFTTGRGQESILVKTWTILTKSLLPLPDKWHGLQDDDERFRKRYLEMITDDSVYNRMIKRSQIISAIRNFFDNLDFIEVETPILQNQAGGANAKTFDTHHFDYDIPMVLRIAVELDHKIIMTSGIPRIYEIGKMFRNEGSDPSHIQEFTMIEWYAAYNTLDDNIKWTEELLKHLAHDIIGKDEFKITDKEGNEQIVNFSGNWTIEKFGDLLKQYANIDFVNITDDELKNEVKKYGMLDDEIKKTSRANMLDFIYKHTVRPKLINPTFVTNYPGVLKPLAQQNADGTARVAQLIIAGMEITNQYAELVDPIIQRELMENQAKARMLGDAEAMDIDERFLTAMEHGMPPMTGFGMGIDRIVAILTEQNNLRDTIFFPIMKPKE